MAAPIINPTQILDSYRKSDAVLIVCQNNTSKIIEIAAINDEAARVLGYTNENLVGKSLTEILPERIGSTLSEFIEYDNDSNDLLTVLGKVRNFSIKTANGSELDFKLRVIRGDAIDRNPWFHLVLVDEEKLRRSSAFRDVLKENFKGHEVMDARTGLPNRISIIKDMELVVYHVRDKEISASFAIIDINRYESLLKEYGPDICNRLHRHVAQICKLKLRGEDTIGTLSERSLGIILVDADQEPARMVLNRLRWAIGVSPIELPRQVDLVAQVNVSFAPIDGKISATEILEKCEAYAVSQRKQINNSVQLVVTHERRDAPARADRRKQNIPVAVDRRKRDRRKT
jgi:diguanylate cyclase (GGDEF)-like protein